MGFIILLALTTLSIAGSAAFFSIHGLAQIFAGSFWAVVVMATSLEAGKLISASYVYRFWHTIPFLMKTYLLTAIFVLMIITSAGIFGFLSGAYQKDTISLKEINSQIVLLEEEKTELKLRKKQIDDNIASINPNYITKRMELIDKLSPETDRINNRLPVITKEIHKLSSQKITEESHVGPIIYIASVFGKSTDDATKWMILLIIFAFDPLAVVLTIATNNALMRHNPKPPVRRRKELAPVIEPEEVEVTESDIIAIIDDDTIPPESFEEENEPQSFDTSEPENLITELQELKKKYPNYNTKDAEKTLDVLAKKQHKQGLSEPDIAQLGKIAKTFRTAASVTPITK